MFLLEEKNTFHFSHPGCTVNGSPSEENRIKEPSLNDLAWIYYQVDKIRFEAAQIHNYELSKNRALLHKICSVNKMSQ